MISLIERHFRHLQEESHLGPQYEWLARMAKQLGVADLELSVHVDDKAAFFLNGKVRHTRDGKWELREEYLGTPLGLFGCFRFPLLRLSKTEMQDLSDERGYREILERTWFCHSPRRGKPCGMCLPCRYAQEEGLARRIPRLRRSWLYRAAWKSGKAVQSLVQRVSPVAGI